MDTKQMALKHLDVIEEALAQMTAILNASQPLGGSYFQEETVLIGRPRMRARLEIISTSIWACRDLLEHQEQDNG